MKKKICGFILVLCIVCGMAAVPAYAASSGTCGDNLTWTLDNNGTLTISGTGEMFDYVNGLQPWYNSRSSIKTIVIANGVTSVGDSAFENCTSLISITIPDSVTSIGYRALCGCTSLTSITIPDGVTSIGNYAVFYCTSLTSINVDENNNNYSSLDGNLYNKDKTTLIQFAIGKTNESFKIPNSVTSIGDRAFENCTSLTSITIPDSVTSIGSYAFNECGSLARVTIGSGVTCIGDGVFSYCCSLTTITIPDSVTSIGEYAFYYCSTLTSITISDGVTSIGDCAFAYCSSLEGITIPDSLTSIGTGEFLGCTSLTSIIIGNGVTSLEGGAFKDCIKLVEITLPFIGESRQASNYERVFGYIFGTQSFDGSYSVSQRYSASNTKTFYLPQTLKKVTITNDIAVPYGAFSGCSSITSISIPDSVTSIGDRAFSGCSSLASVTIGSGVTSLESGAFADCHNLVEITLPFIGRSRQASDSERTFGYIFGTKLFEGSYSVSQRYSASDTKTFYLPQTLKKVTITNDTAVPYGAFNNCTRIYEIDIKEGPDAIENYAFNGCDLLKKVSVPSSVEIVAQYAFSNSSNITIYGSENSYIATFAEKNNIPFVKTNSVEGFDATYTAIGNNIIVTANVPDYDITKNIHAALYSGDGNMIDYMIYPSEYSNNTVHFMFRNIQDLSYIKVFLWGGFETMKPLDDSIVLNVSK